MSLLKLLSSRAHVPNYHLPSVIVDPKGSPQSCAKLCACCHPERTLHIQQSCDDERLRLENWQKKQMDTTICRKVAGVFCYCHRVLQQLTVSIRVHCGTRNGRDTVTSKRPSNQRGCGFKDQHWMCHPRSIRSVQKKKTRAQLMHVGIECVSMARSGRHLLGRASCARTSDKEHCAPVDVQKVQQSVARL